MTRALCLVAHPDDCVIFGWHFIRSHPGHRWSVRYLILADDSPRVEEMRGYWSRHGIDVASFDLPHDPPPSDIRSGRCSIPAGAAREAVAAAVRGHDLVLSHGAAGEYGHPHHRFLHRLLVDLALPFVAFDPSPDAPCRFAAPRDDHAALPLHAKAIARFVGRFGLRHSAGYRACGARAAA